MKLARIFAGWVAEALGDGWSGRVVGTTEDGYAVVRLTNEERRVEVEVHPDQLDDRSQATACAERIAL